MAKPLYQVIYDYLYENIKSGKYADGDRLPSEKELAEEFNVSRITTKKALKMLTENGLLKRMPGKGSFLNLNDDCQAGIPEKAVNPENKRKKPFIGLVITDFSESFATDLLKGIDEEASESGMFFSFRRSHESQELEEKSINEFLELGVDGLIIMPVHGKHYSPKILRLVLDGFPTVLVDRYLKGIDSSFVGTDNVEASKKATDYLLDAGHRHIAFLSPLSVDTSTVEDRIEGFIKSHTEHGIAVDQSIWVTNIISSIPGNYNKENLMSDIDKIKALIEKNPQITCLFTVERNIAIIAQEAVNALGKKIPEDISIICFDGPGSFSGVHQFTHIKQKENDIGRKAVQLMKDQLSNRGGAQRIFFDSELIIGASTREIDCK